VARQVRARHAVKQASKETGGKTHRRRHWEKQRQTRLHEQRWRRMRRTRRRIQRHGQRQKQRQRQSKREIESEAAKVYGRVGGPMDGRSVRQRDCPPTKRPPVRTQADDVHVFVPELNRTFPVPGLLVADYEATRCLQEKEPWGQDRPSSDFAALIRCGGWAIASWQVRHKRAR
jgi:hypothetical protein